MPFKNWESFLEDKKGDEFKPDQGKNTNPYHAPHAKNDPKPLVRVAEKPKDALGDEASPPFKDPKAACPLGEKPDYTPMKVEQFLRETKELSNEEFVDHMMAENSKKKDGEPKEFDPTLTCQFTGRKAVPAYYEVAKYMAHMLPQNESARRAFIRELKGVNGGLNSLLTEILGHGEVYSEMVDQMSLPESKVPRRLTRAMNENYANWMQDMGLMPKPDDDMQEGVDLPVDKRRAIPDDTEDMSSDMGAGEPPVPTDAPADMSGQSPMQDMPPEGQPGLAPGAQPVDPAMTMPEQPPMPQPTREFAYHHMIKEMNKFDNMKKVMQEMLAG